MIGPFPNKWLSPFLCAVCLLLMHVGTHAQPLSICDYTPAQSLILDVNTAVNFRAINNPGDTAPIVNGTSNIEVFGLLDVQTIGVTGEGDLNFDFIDSSRNTINVSPNIKSFLPDNDFFFFIGAGLQSVSFSLESFFEDVTISAPIGWGYGRFRDVTPFVKAIQVQNQLSRFGILQQPFDQEFLEEIAEMIDQHRPDTPMSQLVNQLQAKIEQHINFPEEQSTGNQAASNNANTREPSENTGRIRLGALSLLAIERILQDNSSSKFCGWEASLGLEIQDDFENFFSLFSFRYAVAPASRSQLLLDTKLSFSPNIFSGKRGTFFLDAQMTYNYRLTDNINAQGRYVFLRSSELGSTPIDIQALNVLLELNLNSSVGIAIDTNWSKASGTPGWSRTINIDLNVGFEFF